MRTPSRKPVVVLVLGLIAGVGAGCGADTNKAGGNARKPLVLTLANPNLGPADTSDFVASLLKLSRGTMRIDESSGWRSSEIDYDRGTLADLRAGKVDLAKIGVRSLDELGVTDFQPLVAPLLIDSLALEKATLDGPIPGRLLPGLDRLGVVGVAFLPGALRRPFGKRGPLSSPGAFRGATFGIRPSLVAAATARALGATPQTYVAAHLPAEFDGAELDPVSLEGTDWDTPGTSLVRNVNLWPRMFVVVANAKRWRSLTAQQRALLRRAGRAALGPAITRIDHQEHEVTASLCRRHRLTLVSAAPGQLGAFRRALEPVYASLHAQALLGEISALKRRLGAPTAELPACDNQGGSAATGARTPMDGVYRVTTTPDDLRRAGAPEDEVIPENYGTWTFVFDRGRFANTQEGPGACTWGYGKFTIKGNETDWSFRDGGGIAPTGATNQEGEFFRYHWSRYRDLLTLSAVAGAISPANFRAKQLRLIAATPSRRYFSRRCPPPAAALQR